MKAQRSPANQKSTETREVSVMAVQTATIMGMTVFGKAEKEKHRRPAENAITEPTRKYRGP